MTHFTVLVRYEGDITEAEKKIEEMLAPYDENKEVPRRKRYLSKDSVKRALEHYKKTGMSPSGVVLPTAELTPEEIKDWEGSEGGKDKRGYFYWSTYNPKSKWDWYAIGGRWQGMLTLKAGKAGFYKKREYSLQEGLKREEGISDKHVDIAYLKDVDWDAVREAIAEDYRNDWDEFINDAKVGEMLLPWIDVRDEETMEQYVARHMHTFSTHAVVDATGWHEPSRMGYWAVELDRKEKAEDWQAKFAERWLSNPTDKTVIAVVDCHI